MFLRNIRHLRGAQRLQTLPQRLPIQTATVRSYATLNEKNGNVPKMVQLKQDFCDLSSGRYLSQQANLKEQHDNSSNYDIELVMNKLESFYQLNGFIGNEQLKPLLDSLSANSSAQLTPAQGLLLLNISGCEMPSLSPEERISNFQNIWQHLQQLQQITKQHCLTMLRVLQYNRSALKDHKVFLQEYEKHNGAAKEVLPQLLAVAGASGNVQQSTEILAEMRSLQLALTEQDFCSLLLVHARAHDLDGCLTVQESMQAAGVSISTETQSTLITAYMENGDETKAAGVLQQFRGQFQFSEVLKMLQSVAFSENITQDFVAQLMQQFKADNVKGPEVPIPLRHICIQLLHNGQLDHALSIINALPKQEFQENQDIDTYGIFFLHALFKANCEPEKIIESATQLADSGKNTRALHIAAEIALKRNPPHALKIFEALKKREETLRPHFFWPLMMYNFRRHREAGILRTLKLMHEFKVECDRQTIIEYVIPRLSTILTDPQMALKQLECVGVKTSLVLTPIVGHMLLQNKWVDVAPLVQLYTTKINCTDLFSPLCNVAVHVRATKRYHHFAKLLSCLAAKNIDRKQDFIGQFLIELFSTQARFRNDLHSCKRILSEMQKFGLNISPHAATTIHAVLSEANQQQPCEDLNFIKNQLKEMQNRQLNLANYAEEGSMSVSSFIKHPRDMTIDELENHLVELEAKQMNVRGILRRLLQVCVRDNRLERALEIKQKCDLLHVQTSPGMMASVLELHTKLGDLPNAQRTLQSLQKLYPGFNIDEHKFIDYAALLVKCGQLENAKQLLEERSFNHRITGGDYVLKNVWNLLTNVAHLASTLTDLPAERNLTRETYAFLQHLGYCKTHNTILGPIVRERLLRGDLVAAVDEFKQLAKQYKHTPLQFELLSLVVRLCNKDEELAKKYNCTSEQAQQLLGDITEIVTEIHGVINMNSGLLLAFAESGSDNQLRRLLIAPEFRINEDLLLRNCEHLGQEGAVTTLLRLAKGARGLNRVINEQNIYNLLLKNFVQANNYKAAVNLYDRLEADDELKVSQEFVRNLVQLLQTNNVEIPSNVALRAQIL